MTQHRIYSVSVASVYPHYVAKVEKKGRRREEVDEVMCWLTGHTPESLSNALSTQVSFADFFKHAPQMNAFRLLITGVICGVRVEEVQDPLMREIRHLDKLIDELAKGRPMEKVLRAAPISLLLRRAPLGGDGQPLCAALPPFLPSSA